MIENRSVPADILLPHIVYRDAPAGIQWLSSAFGSVEHYRYGEFSGAQSIWATPGSWSAKRVQGKRLPRNLAAGRKVSRCLVEDVGAHYKGQEPRAPKLSKN